MIICKKKKKKHSRYKKELKKQNRFFQRSYVKFVGVPAKICFSNLDQITHFFFIKVRETRETPFSIRKK